VEILEKIFIIFTFSYNLNLWTYLSNLITNEPFIEESDLLYNIEKIFHI
jgi:hypothetical protein